MAFVSRTSASLRIAGDDLVPDEITTMLGSNPTVARRKGDPMGIPPSHPPARTGMWHIRTEKAEGDALDRQIAAILSPLASDLSIWDNLAARFELDMFCGVWMNDWNQGLALSPRTMKLLAERNIPVEFDIYYERSPRRMTTNREGS